MRLLRQAMAGRIPATFLRQSRAIASLQRREQRDPAGWKAHLAAVATLRAEMDQVLHRERCEVWRSSTQAISPGEGTVSFDSEVYNPFELWDSGDATKITIQRAGIYWVWGQLGLAGSLTGNYIRLRVKRTQADATVTYPLGHTSDAQVTVDEYLNLARMVKLEPEDALELLIAHDSSASRNVLSGSDASPYFGVCRIGD